MLALALIPSNRLASDRFDVTTWLSSSEESSENTVKGLVAYQAPSAGKGQVAVGRDVLVVRIVKRPLLALLGEIAVVGIAAGDGAAQEVLGVVIRGPLKTTC